MNDNAKSLCSFNRYGPSALVFAILIVGLMTSTHVSGLNAQTSVRRPASDVPQAQWWKGNLHTHSLWSDGNDFPEMIVKWYHDRDYHFLALTDHNVLSIGDRWMDKEKILQRSDPSVFEKYEAAWDADWIETRTDPTTKQEQYRLKPLSEYRAKFESPGRFLMIQGEEISDRAEKVPVHMNAINLASLIQPVGGETVAEAINNNLRAAWEQEQSIERPIFVQVNHPNFGWAITAEDLVAATNGRFMEVYNGHPGINHLGDATRPGVERIWDIANTIRLSETGAEPIYGVGTDDSHNYHGKKGSRPGRGWVMVRSDRLQPDALLNAMNNGDFYFSSGVTLSDLQFDVAKNQLSLVIEPTAGVTYQTQFIGTKKGFEKSSQPRLAADGKPIKATRVYSKDIGQVLATDDSLTPSYTLTGDELYVRAVVTSTADPVDPSFKNQKQQAWTQPVGWRK